MLAGLIRAPSQLAPSRNPKAARRRGEVVLEAMVGSRRHRRKRARRSGARQAGRSSRCRPRPNRATTISSTPPKPR